MGNNWKYLLLQIQSVTHILCSEEREGERKSAWTHARTHEHMLYARHMCLREALFLVILIANAHCVHGTHHSIQLKIIVFVWFFFWKSSIRKNTWDCSLSPHVCFSFSSAYLVFRVFAVRNYKNKGTELWNYLN